MIVSTAGSIGIALVLLTPGIPFSLALPVPFKLGREFKPNVIPEELFHLGPRQKPRPPPKPALVTELPGYGELVERSYAGYLQVNASCGSYLYFWLVESQGDPSNDPILIWLNGGPGSSSFLGAMMENGPFRLKEGKLQRNPYSWNRKATYVMIDQPAGVGYSFVEEKACYAPNENIAMDQLYTGLKELFRVLPQYSKLPLYVFGESYAGKYVPQLATRILDDNMFRLEGIGMGDAWVDPKSLQMTYADYAQTHGLLSAGAGKQDAELLQRECLALFAAVESNTSASPDDWRRLDRTCNKIEAFIVKQAGGVNVYDVRSFESNYDFRPLVEYLRLPVVRQALRVDDRAGEWRDCDDTVAYILEAQEQFSSAHLMPRIMASTRVLIYSGIFDMDCNFLSTDAWLSQLNWSHAESYRNAQNIPWSPLGHVWGHGIEVGNLTQMLILGAGHLVPMDEGQAAFAMLEAFFAHQSVFHSAASAPSTNEAVAGSRGLYNIMFA